MRSGVGGVTRNVVGELGRIIHFTLMFRRRLVIITEVILFFIIMRDSDVRFINDISSQICSGRNQCWRAGKNLGAILRGTILTLVR